MDRKDRDVTATKTMGMAQVLDREFLDIRCRIIDIAASMDRVDRAEGHAEANADPRVALLKSAIALLIDESSNRAERVQLAFSDEYDPHWRKT